MIKLIKKQKKCMLFVLPIILVAVLILILARNFLVFCIFLVVNSLLNYYQGKMEFPFDLTPSFVLLILFSIKFGFIYGLIFLFLGSVIPSLIAGGFDHTTFLYVGLAMAVGYLASLSLITNIVFYGLSLIFVQTLFSFFISMLSDDPSKMFSVFLGIALNVLYFLALNRVLLTILV